MEQTPPVLINSGRIFGKLASTTLLASSKKIPLSIVLANEVHYKVSGSGILSLTPDENSYLSKLAQFNVIPGKQFSLDLSSPDSPQLVLGGPSKTYDYSDFSFAPLTKEDEWATDVYGMQIDNKEGISRHLRDPVLANVDISSSLISLPLNLISDIQQHMTNAGYTCWVDGQFTRGLFVCEYTSGITLPDISFDVASSKVSIDGSLLQGKKAQFEGREVLVTKIAVNLDGKISLGEPLLRKYYVWMDGESNRIGFTEYKSNEGGEEELGAGWVLALASASIGCGIWAISSLERKRRGAGLFQEFDSGARGIEIGGQAVVANV